MTRNGPRRRAKGEGSIVQHKASGLWTHAIELPTGADGKRKRRFVYAKTKSELMRKVTDLRAAGGGSIAPRAIGTVGEWIDKWLEDVHMQRRENTYLAYKNAWTLHAKDRIAGISLEKFDNDSVRDLFSHLSSKKVAQATIQKVGVAMRRALNVAIKEGRYRRANPFAMVGIPRHTAKEKSVMTPAQARAFVAAAHGNRYEAAWILMLTAGTRLGETFGLEWKDVDLKRRTVTVRQALVEVRGYTQITEPKTKGSRRTIDIGSTAIDALRRRKKDAAKEEHGSSFVFVTPGGTHPRRSNLRRDNLNPIAKKAKVEGVTPHGLRHTSATMSLIAGTSPKTVAARLGHADPQITLGLYSHYVPELGRQAAREIDAILTAPVKAKRSR
jgi:integrase